MKRRPQSAAVPFDHSFPGGRGHANFMIVGVFGLGPVLPPERLISTIVDPRPAHAGQDDWQLLLLDHLLSERLATRDELARVMDEWKEISAKSYE
jgi:hypothetical protein